jgi:hypothetical protein
MEPLSPQQVARRRFCLMLAASPLAFSVGCFGSKKELVAPEPTKAATVAVTAKGELSSQFRLVPTFSNKITLAADPLKGGSVNPGLLGRVYLFGADPKFPLLMDGELVVDLFDHTTKPGQDEPKMLEQWRFDAATLPKFAKKDMMGDGYSIFLPWGTYGEDLTQIMLQMRFTSTDGKVSVFNQTGLLSLDHRQVVEYQTNSKRPLAKSALAGQ